MSISALPQSTVRLLGSSITITSPLSLVKELVDNSIDAGATSIQVNLTSDTVGRILVRDNGCGIHVDDFGSLGRRAHTSKLRCFDELQVISGQTLGFRGEALASANSLASVKLTTKTPEAPVAWLVHLNPGKGGVKEKHPISGTVGTTVQVVKLFEKQPVRQQNAQKESSKTITKIKELLQTYAFARPNIKMCLKVLGEPSRSWSYSPGAVSSVREAALQLFGAKLIAQCVQVTTKLGSNKDGTEAWVDAELTAYLPIPEYESRVIKDKGAFISIDLRPISSSRGIGKKMYAMFKAHLPCNHVGLTKTLSTPFMQLDIKCMAGSYDPNVTPLKDEVLFADEQKILGAFQILCEKVYKPKSRQARDNDDPKAIRV